MNTGSPMRIVVFTGGAVLEDACVELMARIHDHPELQLLGVFCETRATGFAGIVGDLFRRRGWLAPLLLLQQGLRRAGRALRAPRDELRRRRARRELAPLVHFETDLHAPGVLSRLRELQPDVGAVYGGPILRPALFELPGMGTIGIHHGRLPDYRGKKTTFWALYNGEDTVGVAIQRIGAGLDRGDVLRSGTLPIGRKPLPVVVRELDQLGLQLYLDALLDLRRGEAEFKPQPPGGGALYRDPRAADILLYWWRYLLGLVRPRPGTRGRRT